jgi:hypothetical protein
LTCKLTVETAFAPSAWLPFVEDEPGGGRCDLRICDDSSKLFPAEEAMFYIILNLTKVWFYLEQFKKKYLQD